MNKLAQLIKTGKTVFNTPELMDIWNTNRNTVKSTVYRMIKQKNFIRIKPGFFALKEEINEFELGCKLVPKSYISLFTVLKEKGVIFQEFQTIYLIGNRPQTIKVNNQTFEYHTIKCIQNIPDGIKFFDHYSIATLERAILELFYLFDTDYSDFKITHFDKDIFIRLSKLYNKKTQQKALGFLNHFLL